MEKFIFITKRINGAFVSIVKFEEGVQVGASKELYSVTEPITEDVARIEYTALDKLPDENFEVLMASAKGEEL